MIYIHRQMTGQAIPRPFDECENIEDAAQSLPHARIENIDDLAAAISRVVDTEQALTATLDDGSVERYFFFSDGGLIDQQAVSLDLPRYFLAKDLGKFGTVPENDR